MAAPGYCMWLNGEFSLPGYRECSFFFCPSTVHAHEILATVPVKSSKRSNLKPSQSIGIREDSIMLDMIDNKNGGAPAVVTP